MSRRRELALLALLVAVAAALRLWRLGDVPFGFHPDEGHNALDALRIASGWHPRFLEGNNGREPLFMYLMALALGVLGPTIAHARLAAALAGVAAVVAQWVMARRLPWPRPERIALVSAGLMAAGFWPVAQSRYALRAVLLPVWVAFLVWAWWRALASLTEEAPESKGGLRPAVLWGGLAGGFIGLALWTHLTGRVLILIPLASSGAEVLGRRPRVLVPLAAAAVMAVAVSAPLLAWFGEHPEMLTYRADQVSLLNPEVSDGAPLSALGANLLHLAAAPVLSGDSSWYHNLSHRPIFDAFAAVAFLGGLVIVVADLLGRGGRDRRRASWLLLVTLVVTAAPSALSQGAPNYVRLTGAWPVIYLLPALAAVAAAARLDRMLDAGLAWDTDSGSARRRSRNTGDIVLAGLVLVSGTLAARDYFQRYAPDPGTYDAFNAAAVERGRQVAAAAAESDSTVYVTPAVWNQSVIRFLNVAAPPASFDPREGLVRPAKSAGVYAFDPVEADAAADFARSWPAAERVDLTNSRGDPSLLTFRLAPGPPARTTLADFDGRIALVADTIAFDGADVLVTLEWRAEAATELDNNLFLHLQNSVTGDTVAQLDGPPLGGSYGTNEWRPGERIRQTFRLTPSGPFDTLVTGWYDWRDGTPLGREATIRVGGGS